MHFQDNIRTIDRFPEWENVIDYEKLNNSLLNICENINVDDLKTETMSRWNAILMMINAACVKPIRNIVYNEFLGFNPNFLSWLSEWYIANCFMYNKEISLFGFSHLSGIDTEYIYMLIESDNDIDINENPIVTKLNNDRIKIFRKIVSSREESLSNNLYSSKSGQVGTIAILNHFYGWNETDKKQSFKQAKQLPGSSLPLLE